MRIWQAMLLAALLTGPPIVGASRAEQVACEKLTDVEACERQPTCQWYSRDNGYCGYKSGDVDDPRYRAIIERYGGILSQFIACRIDFSDESLDRVLKAEIGQLYPDMPPADVQSATDLAVIIIYGMTIEGDKGSPGKPMSAAACKKFSWKYRQLRK